MAIDAVIDASVQLDDTEYRKKLGELPKETQMSMSKVALAFGAVTAAVAGVVKGVPALTGAYSKEQDSIVGLQTALRIQGEEYNLNEKRLSAFAGELQKVTKYGDEVTRSAMALGLNMGLSVDNIEDATRAAMGLAEAHNMDLNSAMRLVARAANGNTGRLSMYEIQVDKTKSKQEQFAQVLEQCGRLFNVATANAETLGGRMAQLGNAWGDLKERLGELIAGVFGLGGATGGLAEKLGDLAEKIKNNLDEYITTGQVFLAYMKAIPEGLGEVFGNVLAEWDWFTQNMDKMWYAVVDDMKGFFSSFMDDVVDNMKGTMQKLMNFSDGFFDAFMDAITGRGLDGFKRLFDDLAGGDGISALPSFGNTKSHFARYGVTEMPKMTFELGGLEDNLRKIQEDSDRRLADRLAKKTDDSFARSNGGGASSSGPEAVAKNAVAGSFSAEFLGMMLGYNSPQKETARNTKKTVEMLNKIYDMQEEGEVYA